MSRYRAEDYTGEIDAQEERVIFEQQLEIMERIATALETLANIAHRATRYSNL